MATLANLPLWSEMQRLSLLSSLHHWAFAAALATMVAATLTLLLSLLAWRFTLKPLLALLLLSSMAAYFMLSYGIVIDSSMVANALQTDWREASALLSPRLLLALTLLGLLPTALIWRQAIHYRPWRRQLARNLLLALAAAALLASATLASFQPLASNMRNHRQLRYLINPLNLIYASAHVASAPLRMASSGLEPIGMDAHLGTRNNASKPPLLVLVLGETGRSGNFGLNGYGRPTTPEMERENLASFRNVWSCGSNTAVSVPCMFSHLGRALFAGRKSNFEGLLDVVQHAGMAALWVENQSGCKGVCERVPNVNSSALTDPRFCRAGECHDAIMLEGLEQRLQALPAERRARGVVVVLHQMGSHGPAYSKRSPDAFKHFLPECTSNDLQNCGRAELVNAYDNSIAYTDRFLASTIGWLKHRQAEFDTAMMYVADHGESLGENNIYLHGLPYAIAPDVQKKVPWITWLSAGFEQRRPVRTECLRSQRDRPLSHDNYFHSVLGLLDIRTSLYQSALDVYADCASSY